jgi:hypothetical protein
MSQEQIASSISQLAGGIDSHNLQQQIGTLTNQIGTMQQQISQLAGGLSGGDHQSDIRSIQQQLSALSGNKRGPKGRQFNSTNANDYFVRGADGQFGRGFNSEGLNPSKIDQFFRTGNNGEVPRHVVDQVPSGYRTERIHYDDEEKLRELYYLAPAHLTIVQSHDNETGALVEHLVVADVALATELDTKDLQDRYEKLALAASQKLEAEAERVGKKLYSELSGISDPTLFGDMPSLLTSPSTETLREMRAIRDEERRAVAAAAAAEGEEEKEIEPIY